MVQLLQCALVLWSLTVSRRIVRSGVAGNVVALVRWVVSLAAGALGAWGAGRLFWQLVPNLLLAILLAYAAGAMVFGVVNVSLAHWLRQRHWPERCASALGLPPWCDRLAGFCALVALWVAVLMTVDLAGRLHRVLAGPQTFSSRAAAQRDADVRPATSSDESHETDSADDTQLERVRTAMTRQGEFLRSLGQGIERSKEEFYRAIGAGEMLDQVRAVQQIVALPREDKLWLVERNPDIARLARHPAIRRIAANERLVDTVQRVSAGSLAAIYEIGEDPDVRQLLDDPEVRQILREVDPVALLDEVQRHRRTARLSD